MDELLARFVKDADLERMRILLAWDQELCLPPAGAAGHSELRVTPRERFIDEQVGELLEARGRATASRPPAMGVASRDFDRDDCVPGRLVAEIARAVAAAPVARLEAHQR